MDDEDDDVAAADEDDEDCFAVTGRRECDDEDEDDDEDEGKCETPVLDRVRDATVSFDFSKSSFFIFFTFTREASSSSLKSAWSSSSCWLRFRRFRDLAATGASFSTPA
ncbi:hypothetical protein [Streptacidiphilus melanogenes]|uniref:hypothetical protein n=1 Tax=Streptacidiphilus melanogenes TaxID=411235 RepID=UPI00126A53CA|nr:hypothetical protein [Streptacidiphilus melanogenes]